MEGDQYIFTRTDPCVAPCQKPAVSVCIPTYNRAALLRQAIGSVLEQCFQDFEIVIYDNASTDDTGEVVRSFADERIRYFRNGKNLGHRENWKRCFRAAQGSYLAPLPDDDMMLPENLSKKIEFLRQNPHVGLVHSKYHVIDQDSQILIRDTNWGHGTNRAVDSLEKREDLLVAFINTINLPTVVFTRACYERVGEFSDRIPFAYDWEYWMRIAVYYDIAFLAEPLVKWRIHSSSLTQTEVRDPLVQLREDLTAKKELFMCHGHAITGCRQLKRQMWRNMAQRLLFRDAPRLFKDGLEDGEVSTRLLKMCLSFPGMLCDISVPKILFKIIFGKSGADLLKPTSRFDGTP
jgi:glycosyltransferase involved in cell wall biosynthesis